METGQAIETRTNSFAVDCTIETDQPAMIPDEYMDITAEKIRIYKQLDSMSSEKEIDRLHKQLEDRFGKTPAAVDNLFNIVKIRNIGSALGFEKIIIKNGMFILFFITNQMSPYYKSKQFSKVLERVAADQRFAFKQSEGKLKLITRGIDSTSAALEALKKLQ